MRLWLLLQYNLTSNGKQDNPMVIKQILRNLAIVVKIAATIDSKCVTRTSLVDQQYGLLRHVCNIGCQKAQGFIYTPTAVARQHGKLEWFLIGVFHFQTFVLLLRLQFF